MQANNYDNLSRHELECRLKFLENQLKFMTSELAKANEKNDKLTEQNKEYKVELDRIIELYKLALDRLFGKKAEKIEVVTDGQLSFFSEIVDDISVVTPKQIVAAHNRAKKRTFKQIYGNLPQKIEYYALTEEEKICPCCGKEMHMFAPESRMEIVHQPAVFEVHEIQREKCYCRNCECRTNEKGESLPSVYRIAKAPEALIEGSYASPSLMASEINKKFALHMPITRIESEYTSKAHAEKEWRISPPEDGRRQGCEIRFLRHVLNNMFHKQVIFGLCFNSDDPERSYIIPKPILEMFMPGPKPKPKGFREPD